MRSGECHRHARTDVSVVFTSSSVMIIHCQCRQRKHTFSLRDENMKLLPVCWPLLRPLAAQGPSAAGPCPWVTHSQSLCLSLSLCVCFVSIYVCVPSLVFGGCAFLPFSLGPTFEVVASVPASSSATCCAGPLSRLPVPLGDTFTVSLSLYVFCFYIRVCTFASQAPRRNCTRSKLA